MNDSITSNEKTGTPDKSAKQSATNWSGLIALLIAILAAAGVGYLWMTQQQQLELNDRITGSQRELLARGTQLSQITDDIDRLLKSDEKLDENIASLTQRIERQLEELPARMTRIEGALDKVAGIDNKERSAWLLAEAEYFMRLANAQLNLTGDVDVALRALDLADAKLKDIGDPGLTRVRAKLSDERTALKAVPRPDAEGIMLELGSLARSLDKLPFAKVAPNRFVPPTQGNEETGLDRAWRVIVDALKSIISIRRSDETLAPLMSAEEESLLLRSLDVELQLARLAVIRNDGELYLTSLNHVTYRLERYFDTGTKSVQAAQETLKQLSAATLPGQLPDISGSLSLLLRLGDEAAAP